MTDTTGWQSRADDAIGSVAGAVAAAQERVAAAAQLRARLDEVRGRGTSRHGEVEAVTDATGRVVDLRFAEKALDLSAAELTRATLDAIGAARRTSGAAAVGLARETWGDGSPTVALLAAELGHRLGDDAAETR